jgi:hypothetical protein
MCVRYLTAARFPVAPSHHWRQMVSLPPSPRWTMSVPLLRRKRSRLALDDDDDELRREPSPSPSFGDALKRSRTQCELEELDIIGVDDAWSVDVDAILASARVATPVGSALVPHDNWGRLNRGESMFVLCVQGNVQDHYELLWYAIQMLLLMIIADSKQLNPPRPLRPLAIPPSPRPLPRSLHAQTLVQCAVLAATDTSRRAFKQPLRSPRAAASVGWWEIPVGRTGRAGPTWTTENGTAVWMGCWQARVHAGWAGHTNTFDEAVEELCGDD